MVTRPGEGEATFNKARRFYETADENRWGRESLPDLERSVMRWVAVLNPAPEKVLVELGAGRGAFRHLSQVGTYVGVDISHEALRRHIGSPCALQADLVNLPLKGRSADFVFSIATLEHIPNPEAAIEEIDRILKRGGIAFLAPAWFCRPWAAEGLPIRSFRELSFANKIRKALIPLRNSVLWRSAFVLPRRLFREIQFRCAPHGWSLWYRHLRPNLEEFIYTDCDAFSSLDPHEVTLFFMRRGYEILSGQGLLRRLTLRHEPVVIKKAGNSD